MPKGRTPKSSSKARETAATPTASSSKDSQPLALSRPKRQAALESVKKVTRLLEHETKHSKREAAQRKRARRRDSDDSSSDSDSSSVSNKYRTTSSDDSDSSSSSRSSDDSFDSVSDEEEDEEIDTSDDDDSKRRGRRKSSSSKRSRRSSSRGSSRPRRLNLDDSDEDNGRSRKRARVVLVSSSGEDEDELSDDEKDDSSSDDMDSDEGDESSAAKTKADHAAFVLVSGPELDPAKVLASPETEGTDDVTARCARCLEWRQTRGEGQSNGFAGRWAAWECPAGMGCRTGEALPAELEPPAGAEEGAAPTVALESLPAPMLAPTPKKRRPAKFMSQSKRNHRFDDDEPYLKEGHFALAYCRWAAATEHFVGRKQSAPQTAVANAWLRLMELVAEAGGSERVPLDQWDDLAVSAELPAADRAGGAKAFYKKHLSEFERHSFSLVKQYLAKRLGSRSFTQQEYYLKGAAAADEAARAIRHLVATTAASNGAQQPHGTLGPYQVKGRPLLYTDPNFVPPEKIPGRRTQRCKQCEGCLRSDCGSCNFCKDKPKFGGAGTLKKACVYKTCIKLTGAVVALPSELPEGGEPAAPSENQAMEVEPPQEEGAAAAEEEEKQAASAEASSSSSEADSSSEESEEESEDEDYDATAVAHRVPWRLESWQRKLLQGRFQRNARSINGVPSSALVLPTSAKDHCRKCRACVRPLLRTPAVKQCKRCAAACCAECAWPRGAASMSVEHWYCDDCVAETTPTHQHARICSNCSFELNPNLGDLLTGGPVLRLSAKESINDVSARCDICVKPVCRDCANDRPEIYSTGSFRCFECRVWGTTGVRPSGGGVARVAVIDPADAHFRIQAVAGV